METITSNGPVDGGALIPKVLLVDLSKNFGGANTRVLGLLQRLPREQVALAALQDSPVAIEAEHVGAQVFLIGRSKHDPKLLINLVSVIRKNGFQLLDTQNPQSKFWGSVAAALTGVGLISTLNSWYGAEHSGCDWRGKIYPLLELNTNFFLNRYIVVSELIRHTIERYGVPSEKIDLIYNAVDRNLPAVANATTNVLIDLPVMPGDVLLVAVGRLTWAKGYEDLISAVKILIEAGHTRICCLVAGDGELRESLSQHIVEAGVAEKFYLLGHLSREKIVALISAADIFVMPSRSEGTPIALLEAAIMKKPIVSTWVGGIPDLVTDKENCLLVEPGNARQLAGVIGELIDDPELRYYLASRAFDHVYEKFSLESQALATIRTYNKALGL
jgi:glycosyltransferase involved in cell wall biosynthesis